jgi:site-specific recombinase XerD
MNSALATATGFDLQLGANVTEQDLREQLVRATPPNTKRTRESHLTEIVRYCRKNKFAWASMIPSVVWVDLTTAPKKSNRRRARRIVWSRNYQEVTPFRVDWLGSYLLQLHRAGYSLKSIDGRLDALNAWHNETYANEKRAPLNPTKHPTILELRKSFVHDIAKANERGERKVVPAPAVTLEDLRAMVCACDLTTATGVRDRAILLLGFWGAFRRSELASIRVENIEYDSQGRGMVIHVYNTKTNKTGSVDKEFMYRRKDLELCPITAYESWVKTAGITSGVVFRRVSRAYTNKNGEVTKPDVIGHILPNSKRSQDSGEIDSRVIDKIVRHYATTAGIKTPYSAHSLRAGWATWAQLHGIPEAYARKHGGWAFHSAMYLHYGARANYYTVDLTGVELG